jgi:hypothetical protein
MRKLKDIVLGCATVLVLAPFVMAWIIVCALKGNPDDGSERDSNDL